MARLRKCTAIQQSKVTEKYILYLKYFIGRSYLTWCVTLSSEMDDRNNRKERTSTNLAETTISSCETDEINCAIPKNRSMPQCLLFSKQQRVTYAQTRNWGKRVTEITGIPQEDKSCQKLHGVSLWNGWCYLKTTCFIRFTVISRCKDGEFWILKQQCSCHGTWLDTSRLPSRTDSRWERDITLMGWWSGRPDFDRPFTTHVPIFKFTRWSCKKPSMNGIINTACRHPVSRVKSRAVNFRGVLNVRRRTN